MKPFTILLAATFPALLVGEPQADPPALQGRGAAQADEAPLKALASLGYLGQDEEQQDEDETDTEGEAEAEVDEGPPPPPPDQEEQNAARAMAVTALDELRINDALLEGHRSHDQGESSNNRGGVFIINGRVQGEGGASFVGDLEAYVRADGVSCIVSKSAIPGFGVWMGKRKLVHSTYDKAPFDLAETQQELKGIFDFERLLDRSKKADWHAAEEVTNGGWFLEAQLPGDLVPTESDDNNNRFGGGSPVLHVNIALVLDVEGRLTEADFDVVRSNGMNGVRFNGRPASDSNIGATSTYSFRVSYGAPSERILWFSRMTLQMLGPEE